MTAVVFGDRLGPQGRRKVRVATAIATVLVGGLLVVAYRRFEARGQLEGELWSVLFTGESFRFFLGGLSLTLQVAATAGVLALLLAGVLATGRLSKRAPVRLLATGWIELFRGIPLVLLIVFCFFALPRQGLDLGAFWSLVTGLVLYNSAVLAEIIRAGIVSLDRGQAEAGRAIGLTEGQTMRTVVLPQALRRMVPSLVSQIVVLLKDTSLGVAISLEELLRRGQIAGQALNNPLQSLLFVAAIYLVVNGALSQVARRLERRQGQGRSKKTINAGPVKVTGQEDLAVL